MPARVARPARKILHKRQHKQQGPLDLGRLQGKNFLPTTATAVYGVQPQYFEPKATKGWKNKVVYVVVFKILAVVVQSTVSAVRSAAQVLFQPVKQL